MIAFAVFLCGLAMLVAGVWLWSEAAGLVVGGGALVLLAVLYERSEP